MKLRILALRLAIIVAFAALWEVAARLGWVTSDVLPPLSTVVATLWRLLGDRSFLNNAAITGVRVAAGFLIAVPLAILLGIGLSRTVRIKQYLSPVVYFIMAVPQSIFLPLFIMILGIGSTQKIVFGTTHALFVMSINIAAAIRSVPGSYLTAARSFGASTQQIYRVFYFPAMLPIILTGFRLGLIYDVLGVLLAEMYASRDGLGMLIFLWGENLRVQEMLAAILLISAFTILMNELIRIPETRFDRWRLLEATR